MENIEDVELVENYLNGDDKALEALIKRYITNIYNFVLSFVFDRDIAEDITQDVFIKVWKNIKKFKKDKNFKTWLYTISRNTSIDHIRKRKDKSFSEFGDEDDNILEAIEGDEKLPDEILERRDLSIVLQRVINELPEKYRTVLLLHYKNELSFQEISKIVDKPIDTVKSQYRRALILLKKLLNN